MIKLFDRYVLKELFPPFALGLLIYTFVLLMNQILLLSEYFIDRGVPLKTVLSLLVYLIPSVLAFTVPMSVLRNLKISHPLLACFAEALCQRWVVQDLLGCPCPRGTVADRHEEAGLAGDDQITAPGDVGGNDGNGGGHRFHYGVWQALVLAAEPKDVEVRQDAGDVASFAEQTEMVAGLQQVDETLKLPPLGAIADH